ncbi:MAG: hypothetical protein ACLUUJ_03315 [Acutalibacteraceae bacterium]
MKKEDMGTDYARPEKGEQRKRKTRRNAAFVWKICGQGRNWREMVKKEGAVS